MLYHLQVVSLFASKLYSLLELLNTAQQFIDTLSWKGTRELYGAPATDYDVLVIDLDLCMYFMDVDNKLWKPLADYALGKAIALPPQFERIRRIILKSVNTCFNWWMRN